MNAPNEHYRPLLSDAARPSTFNVKSVDENGQTKDTPIAGEHPLTLYVDKQELLTLMTLGGAPEALAIGYLRNQRLVKSLDEIAAVQVDWETNSVAVKTRHGLENLEAKLGKRTTTSGCGQGTVFGDLMEEIDSVRLPGDATLTRSSTSFRTAADLIQAAKATPGSKRRLKPRNRRASLSAFAAPRARDRSRSIGFSQKIALPAACAWRE